MAIFVSAAAAGPSAFNTIVDMGRKIVVWRDMLSKTPKEFGYVLEDIEEYAKQLAAFDKNSFLSQFECIPHYDYVRKRLCAKFEQCEKELTRMRSTSEAIEEQRNFLCRKLYPATLEKMVSDVQQKLANCQKLITVIESDMDVLVHAKEKFMEATIQGNDEFKIIHDMVPKPPVGIVMDFDSQDSEGNPITFEGRLKRTVFGTTDDLSKGMVVLGEGGVGKTCALQAIGLLENAVERFPGGVLYFVMGKDASLLTLIENLAWIVERTGGHAMARKVRGETDLKRAVFHVKEWFRSRTCLFLIDDIWCVNEITKQTLDELSNITADEQSRFVYTSRDLKVVGNKHIRFEPRAPRGPSSRAMLLESAQLSEPRSSEALNAFNRILDFCSGLPIALSLVGAAVRYLDEYECKRSPSSEYAWSAYQLSCGKTGDSMSAILNKSLDVLHHQNELHNYREKLNSLCILRKSQSLPRDVLKRLWCMDIQADFDSLLDGFKRFCIIREERGRNICLIQIHDLLLDEILGNLADPKLSCKIVANRLIKTYVPKGESTVDDVDDVDDEFVSMATNPLQSDRESRGLRWLKNCLPCCSMKHTLLGRETGRAITNHPSVQVLTDSVRSFENSFLNVPNDGYIWTNIFWLLNLVGRLGDMKWLLSQPQWILKQFGTYGTVRIDEDVHLTMNVMREYQSAISSSQSSELMEFLGYLQKAIWLASKSSRLSTWNGMISFQLFGRLVHVAEENTYARDFLVKLRSLVERGESWVPRPWMKPEVGVLPDVTGPLKHVFHFGGNRLSPSFADDVVLNDDALFVLYRFQPVGTSKQVVIIQHFNVRNRNAAAGEFELWKVDVPSKTGGDQVICGKISPDGSSVVLGLDNGNIQLFQSKPTTEVSTGIQSMDAIPDSDQNDWFSSSLSGHQDAVRNVAIGNGGNLIVSCSEDKTIHVWTFENESWVRLVLNDHVNVVRCVSISDNCCRIVSGSDDGTVRIWDCTEGAWITAAVLEGLGAVESVAITRNEGVIVSGSRNGTTRVWAHKLGIWTPSVLSETDGYVSSISLSKNNQRMISLTSLGELRLWEHKNGSWSGSVVEAPHVFVACICIGNDGEHVVFVSRDHSVTLWDSGNRKLESRTSHDGIITGVAISKDGTRIATSSRDRTIRVLDLKNGRWDTSVLSGHSGCVQCISMSDDGASIASGSDDCTVLVWEMEKGVWQSFALTGHTLLIYSLAMTSDGACIVSGSADKTLRVWKRGKGSWDSSLLVGHTDIVLSVVIGADGNQIVSGSFDSTVRVWECQNQEWVSSVLSADDGSVWSVDISKNSNRIVSGTGNDSVWMWEFGGGKWRGEQVGQVGGSTQVAFSTNDGNEIVASVLSIEERIIWRNTMGQWRHLRRGKSDIQEFKNEILKKLKEESGEGDFVEASDAFIRTILEGHEHGFPELGSEGIGKVLVESEGLQEVRVQLRGLQAWRTRSGYFFILPHKPYFVPVELIT